MIESVQLWLRKSFAGFPWNWPDWCERERSIMTTPVLREVTSSYLKRVGYDPETEELFVEFPSGKVWKYLYVAVETYHELLEAESIGKYFIANIKKRPEDHPGEPVG